MASRSRDGHGDTRHGERVWLKWAEDVFQSMHEWKPTKPFGKPAAFPTFLKIRAAQDALRSGKTAKKARELVGQYNVWLDTVLRAESENAGLLVVMLHAYCLLDERRKGEMKRYLMKHWCRADTWHEPELARDRLDALAAWHCRNVEILPTWLMNGNDVPDSAYESEGLDFDPDKYASEFDDEPKERSRSVGSGESMPMPDFSPGASHD